MSSADRTPLLSSLWPFTARRAPESGTWPEDMRDRIVEHVRTEHGAMLEYERLAEETEAEDIAYLMQIVLDDERRHHRWFRELRNSLEAAIELRDTGATVPAVGTTSISREVLDATRRLLAIEREDKEELQTLRKAMKPVEDSTLWALLVDVMLHDTEKHIAILEQIFAIAEERVED